MPYTWADDRYRELAPIVQEARALLEDWFQAIEAGMAQSRMPDPLYPAQIDSDTADAVIGHLDAEFERELNSWAKKEVAGAYTAGPGFARLGPAQRLALVQQLHALKLRHQDAGDKD